MRPKFEGWIPKLGREVDATKPAWRFDAIEIRGLDSNLGFKIQDRKCIRRSQRGGQLGIRCCKFK